MRNSGIFQCFTHFFQFKIQLFIAIYCFDDIFPDFFVAFVVGKILFQTQRHQMKQIVFIRQFQHFRK